MISGIGLFGGSFDPFHKGHEFVLTEGASREEISKIIIIPTRQSPLKENAFVSAKNRYRVLQKYVQSRAFEVPVEVCDIEIAKESISWTIETVKAMKREYPHHPLFLIIGADSLFDFHHWKQYEDILKLTTLIVIKRGHLSAEAYSHYIESKLTPYRDNIILHESRTYEVSSSEIRRNPQKIDFVPGVIQEEVKALWG